MQIQVKNLTHIYSEGMPFESTALEEISFEVEKGEFIGIIGHTGSGKSTLIQHLNGLLKPKSGQILIDDIDITDKNIKMQEIRKKIGLVFQYPEYQLFEETVQKDVAFGPLNLGLPEEKANERVKEALELVGLDYKEIMLRSPFELSGGQKRRVAIAGVIAMKPEVLILDEPTAGLDPRAHQSILNMIQRIHQNQRNTIILISHNMGDIARLADRVIVMDSGKIVMIGSPRYIFQQADLLEELGLGLPPASELLLKLKKGGIPVVTGALTMAEAEEELYRYLAQKNRMEENRNDS